MFIFNIKDLQEDLVFIGNLARNTLRRKGEIPPMVFIFTDEGVTPYDLYWGDLR